MPAYTVTSDPVPVDAGASTSIQVQNAGTNTVRILPLGRNVAPGSTVTVPGWSGVPTQLRTADGLTSTAVVTLTSGTPAAGPGPGPFLLDPDGAGTMVVTITGGTWFSDEGLKTAITFPLTVTGATRIYPAAAASISISAVAGGITKTAGHTIVPGDGGSFTFALSLTDLTAISGGGGGGGAVSSVVGQVGAVTGTQILADTTVAAALAGKDASGAAAAAQAAAIAASAQRASNLSDLASAGTARTNLGLAAGATMSTTASGDLSGTLPAPTVAKINGVTVTGTPTSGQVMTATSGSAATWQNTSAGGGLGTPTTKTANYTAVSGDLVLMNTSGGGFTITSPAATNGAYFVLKKKTADTNTVTVSPASGTIDGASSFQFSAAYSAFTLVNDGTNWWVL